MRCLYCRPGVVAHAANELLSADELESLVRHLVGHHGLRKIRLTGGEPTARGDLVSIIERLSSVEGLDELTLTTNGLSLARMAHDLVRAGLGRVNVSLDSLDAERFARLTGVRGLERVLHGIDAAVEAGLSPVKLNSVVLRGHNDDEIEKLLRFAVGRGLEIRFIELMPLGPLAARFDEWYVSEAEIRERLAASVARLEPLPHASAAARRHSVVLRHGGQGTVGFVTPMSHDFCDGCDRIRIAADGAIYPCLMGSPVGSVREALRPELDGGRLDRVLESALGVKPARHAPRGPAVMTDIGG
jgi:cyclic pyranopterin phosphate synthase